MEILNHQVKMQHKRKGGTEREREKENGTIIISLNFKFVLKSINSLKLIIISKVYIIFKHTLTGHGIEHLYAKLGISSSFTC